MNYIFTDLKTDWPLAWAALVLSGIFFAALLFALIFDGANIRGGTCVALAVAGYISLLVFFMPSLIKAAHENHEHLITVGLWSFLLVVGFIVVSIYSFFSITGQNHEKYNKLLNLLPVILGMWAAAVGWLIHFKITTKTHRTNNAFSIIMETRKNAEFLKRLEVIAKHFPPSSLKIPDCYHKYFSAAECAAVLMSEGNEIEVERAEAIRALKYVLNYYEFMAIGVKAKDLDEKILFDTLHKVVTSLYKRSKLLADYLADESGGHPGADKTTWCELRSLVIRWEEMRKHLPDN